jgi:ribosomal protein L37AE/L43A
MSYLSVNGFILYNVSMRRVRGSAEAIFLRLTCQNRDCLFFLKLGQGNILRATNYGEGMWKCRACKKVFHTRDARDEIDFRNELKCPNATCGDHGFAGKGNIIKASKYGAGKRRWKCKTCGKTFSESNGTVDYRKRIPKEKLVALNVLRQKGYSIRGIADAIQLNKNTILRYLKF